jgi:TRAP-type C4-dicarboxylate transport system permease small subunit
MLERITHILGRFSDPLAHRMNQIAGLFLIAMMLLTGLDVFTRYFLNSPIPGSYEIIQYIMPMVVAFGMAQCALKKKHVQIDLITSLLPNRIQQFLKSIAYLIMFIMFALISWQSFLRATGMYASGQYTEVLYMPIFPFVYTVVLSCAALSIVALRMFFQYLAKIGKP